MKKTVFPLYLLLFSLFFTLSCASSNKSQQGQSGDIYSLEEAIEFSAESIALKLPGKSRVAIVAFSSEHENLSNYIMDELAGALVVCNIEVADRRNLEYVYRELNFQMSGDVSDETAVSIGKFLGAQYVITGQLIKAGKIYRYRLSGLNVETAVQEVSIRLNVRNDRNLQRLISDIKKTNSITSASINTSIVSHGVSVTNTPRTAGEYLDRGIYFASIGQFDLAILEFTEAIRLDTGLTAAWLLRGRAYYASVSYVTSTGENFSSVYATIDMNRNRTVEQIALYDRAIADFSQVIRLEPNNAHAFRERGVAYADKGDHDSGIMDLSAAIRINPNYTMAYNNRGNAYRRKRDYNLAIADYNQAIRLDPNLARAYMNRGSVYGDMGEHTRAISDRTQAIRLDPQYAPAYSNRGSSYVAIKDYNRAIADFDQAIRLDPNQPIYYINRGAAYFLIQDYPRARADWTIALRLDPNNAALQQHIERLRLMGY